MQQVEAMPSKDSIYGLFSPIKLNPNLVVIGIIIVILTMKLVYSGRHSKIIFFHFVTIETSIPQLQTDSSSK